MLKIFQIFPKFSKKVPKMSMQPQNAKISTFKQKFGRKIEEKIFRAKSKVRKNMFQIILSVQNLIFWILKSV